MCGLFSYQVTICPPAKQFAYAEKRRRAIEKIVTTNLMRRDAETLEKERREIAARKRKESPSRRKIAGKRR